jgi:hypothetical protein
MSMTATSTYTKIQFDGRIHYGIMHILNFFQISPEVLFHSHRAKNWQ